MTQHVLPPQPGKGRIKDPRDDRDHTLRMHRAPRPTPLRHSWLGKQGKILDQGNTPQCVAYGSAYVKTFQERRQHHRTYTWNENQLYQECKQRDGIPNEDGTFTRVALEVMRTMGYGREAKPWERDAPGFKIAAYARLRTIGEIEQALTLAPILIGMTWLHGWTDRTLLLDTPQQIIDDGGHLMACFGYSQPEAYIELPQTWGPDAHDHGIVRMSYRELERQLALPDDQSMDVWAVLDAA